MDDSQKNDNKTQELMSEFQTLTTFANAKAWGKRAADEIERITGIVRAIDIEIARTSEALERAKYEQAQKPLVGRLFGGSNNEEKELTERLEQIRQSKSEQAEAARQLQESMDFTPTSPEQQKALIQELRQRSRELQEKKREITTVMRGPRSQPKLQGDQADMAFDPETIKRRKLRYAKEVNLLPQEKTHESINRQIAQVDHDIAWAEKFS